MGQAALFKFLGPDFMGPVHAVSREFPALLRDTAVQYTTGGIGVK